jgi:acyl carrier protein
MSVDSSDEATLRIARFIVIQSDYDGPATDFVGSQPVRLKEAMDSAGLMELATFVEDEFSVLIADDEIVPENFATVADIIRLIRSKGALSALSEADDEGRERSRS